MMKKLLFLMTIFLFGWSASYCQQLVYKPINPAFGGNEYNYTWLLSSAQAQNKFSDSSTSSSLTSSLESLTSSSSTTTLQQLKTEINNQILNQLSTYILQSVFGTSTQLTNGTYKIGNYKVSIGNSSEGVTIDISDITSGEHSQVVVPYL